MNPVKITMRNGGGSVEINGVNVAENATAFDIKMENGLCKATFTLVTTDVEVDVDDVEIQEVPA